MSSHRRFFLVFFLIVFSALALSKLIRHPSAETLSAKTKELQNLALASYGDPRIDQNISLDLEAPLPSPCRMDDELVSFCAGPFPIQLLRSRYEFLRARWGDRTSPPARIRKLMQKSPHQWVLQLAEGQEKPLIWLDPNHPNSFLVWPVSLTISQIQAPYHSVAPPKAVPVGTDTLRLDFEAQHFPRFSKIKMFWSSREDLQMIFSPSKKPFRILLDPGHGGSDPGAFINQQREADLNLRAATRLKAALEKRGMTVQLLRDTDVSISLARRFRSVQDGAYDLALSIHHDSVPTDKFEDRPACFYAREDLNGIARDLCEVITKLHKGYHGMRVPAADGTLRALIEKPKSVAVRRYLMGTMPDQSPSLLLELLDMNEALSLDSGNYEKFLTLWARDTAQLIDKNLSASASAD